MKYTDLKIGTKLELEIYNEEGIATKRRFISQLEFVEEKNIAVIAAPISEGVIYPVQVDAVISACFVHGNALYRFKGRVLKRAVKDSLSLLKIGVTDDLERIQRREFFRFDDVVSFRFRQVHSLVPENNGDVPFIKTYTTNLSGGGVNVLTGQRVENGRLVECELQLKQEEPIRFFGRVVWSEVLGIMEGHKYKTAICFKKIENRDREIVIGYIFNQQRKLRKKGLM